MQVLQFIHFIKKNWEHIHSWDIFCSYYQSNIINVTFFVNTYYRSTNRKLILAILKFLSQILGFLGPIGDKNTENCIANNGLDVILNLLSVAYESSEDNINVEICIACLNILSKMANFHPIVDINDRILVPTPFARQKLSEPHIISKIINLLTLD